MNCLLLNLSIQRNCFPPNDNWPIFEKIHRCCASNSARVTRSGDFLPIGLLLEAHDFLKKISSPKKWWHFGLLFAEANLLHFHLNIFKTLFVVGILRFQKWFGVDVLGFQIELCCRYFGLFWLGNSLGYFFGKLGNFFILIVF